MATQELALSAKLILDTATTLDTTEFQERFKADPTLPGLHPLAKAFAYGELDKASRRLTKKLIRSALQTCWLYYVPAVENVGSNNNPEHEETEYVAHKIGLCEFWSQGLLHWIDDRYSGRFGSVSFQDIKRSILTDTDLTLPGTLFSLWMRHNRLRPSAYITDDGDCSGTIGFNLVRIGPFLVGSQTIDVSSVHEVEIDGAGTKFGDLVLDEEGDDNVCWLNLLSEEQAQVLGIPENKTPSSHNTDDSEPYPAWVDRKWARKNGWISIDDLEDSYSSGNISPKRISFLIGQDEIWAPQPPNSYPSEEEEEEFEGPPTPSLFAWEVKVDDASVNGTLAMVLGKISQIVAHVYGVRTAVPPHPAP